MAKSNKYGYPRENDCTNRICHVTVDICTDIHSTEEETSLNVQTPSTSGGVVSYQLTNDGSHVNDDLDLEQIPTFHTVNHSKGKKVVADVVE